jgi:hypothetical protein
VVVVVSPQGQLAASISQTVADILIEALGARAAIERLEVAVLLGLAGVDFVPLDPVVGRPLQDAEVRAMPSAQSSDVIGPELPAGQLAGILRSGRSVMAQGKTTVGVFGPVIQAWQMTPKWLFIACVVLASSWVSGQ